MSPGSDFLLLELLPINFSYLWFAVLIFVFAVGMGLFFSPNQAAVMNSLPPEQRGAGAGMLNTFQNSATVLSMGLFFTIVTLGLASRLPSHLYRGLVAAGVAPAAARTVASEPPIGSLFSAFLGYNPVKELLGPTGALQHLSARQAAYITGPSFFPKLIEQPFASGLRLAFTFAAGATLIAIVASAARGRRYLHAPEPVLDELAEGAAESAGVFGLDQAAGLADLDAARAPGAAGAAANGEPGRPPGLRPTAIQPGEPAPAQATSPASGSADERGGPCGRNRGRRQRPAAGGGGLWPRAGRRERAAARHRRRGHPGRRFRAGAALLPADRPDYPGQHHLGRNPGQGLSQARD